MTYEENYSQYSDLEELVREVQKDINLAIMLNPTTELGSNDRIKKIIESAEKVLNKNFSDVSDDVLKQINEELKK